MVKPFDLAKFRREHNKKHGVKDGFYDPITWIDTGNYALNRMISGNFHHGVPLGAVTVFAGESGSAKSYIVSGNIVRNALAQGITVIVIDTEGALGDTWMRKLGVDTAHPNLVRYGKSTINHLSGIIGEVMDQYAADNKDVPREEQQKVLFVVDSLGFLQSEAEIEQFEKAELKGDKGIKPRQLKMLVSNCIRLFNGYEVGLVATNHTYKSQDMYKPDDVISGGQGFIFAASIIVSMNKKKLKDENSTSGAGKAKKIAGITAQVKCVKTRYSKPFEDVDLDIPYDRGMDPYGGLFDLLEGKNVFRKAGSYYIYTAADGTEIKQYRKDMTPAFFDRVMAEWLDNAAEEEAGEAAPHPETTTGDVP